MRSAVASAAASAPSAITPNSLSSILRVRVRIWFIRIMLSWPIGNLPLGIKEVFDSCVDLRVVVALHDDGSVGRLQEEARIDVEASNCGFLRIYANAFGSAACGYARSKCFRRDPRLCRDVRKVANISRTRTPRMREERSNEAPESFVPTLPVNALRGFLLYLRVR